MGQQDIVRYMKERMVGGTYKPGERLPTRRELSRVFRVNGLTVQRAFQRLIDEGFVEARGRGGTFVKKQPPFLNDYGIVFACSAKEAGSNRFWAALRNAVHDLAGAGARRRILTYWQVDAAFPGPDYQRLLDDIAAHRLAGLVFATLPNRVRNTPILDTPDLPRVAIAPKAEPPAYHAVDPNAMAFLERALDYLAAQGKKRVAFVAHPAWPVYLIHHALHCAEERGLEMRPGWVQCIPPDFLHWAERVVSSIMAVPFDERPDGLVILDDNLTEAVYAEVARGGVRQMAELEVVSHCNFPIQPGASLPVCRLGYDIPAIVEECLDRIERLRQGESVEPMLLIDPVFEAERTSGGDPLH